ncbi:hypothetical protein GCM10011613_23250 [Cellvibrio zantedeschiae]|uniref:Lipoprotein n=1 Tax=Cellvibrio zantedeschiae TaxID=1237077 RepID=A0ABQ3B4E4_9GAMM|nr:hypothetical protein [Cellvibrio zantedeschiae]GGY78012.1 hypothetical protein GCM10011613_23250 [Cellvibrio zantedeschiae]
MLRVNKIIVVAFFFSLFVLTSCSSLSHKSLPQSELVKFQGATAVATKYKPENFEILTAGNMAVGGMLGAVLGHDGNAVVKENDIRDPAVSISAKLVEKFKTTYAMKIVESDAVAKKDDLKALVVTYPKVDYLIDVKTISWMAIYYPLDWTHYSSVYKSRLRIIDLNTSKVIAESVCLTNNTTDQNRPTYDQLIANKAAILKAFLDKDAQQCVDNFVADIF